MKSVLLMTIHILLKRFNMKQKLLFNGIMCYYLMNERKKFA